MKNLQIKEQGNQNQLSQEAKQIIELLDKIEDHTAELRKKLMSELKSESQALHLKLDNI